MHVEAYRLWLTCWFQAYARFVRRQTTKAFVTSSPCESIEIPACSVKTDQRADSRRSDANDSRQNGIGDEFTACSWHCSWIKSPPKWPIKKSQPNMPYRCINWWWKSTTREWRSRRSLDPFVMEWHRRAQRARPHLSTWSQSNRRNWKHGSKKFRWFQPSWRHHHENKYIMYRKIQRWWFQESRPTSRPCAESLEAMHHIRIQEFQSSPFTREAGYWQVQPLRRSWRWEALFRNHKDQYWASPGRKVLCSNGETRKSPGERSIQTRSTRLSTRWIPSMCNGAWAGSILSISRS